MIRRRFLDWRLAISLALLMLVGFLVFSGVANERDNQAKGHRIDVLVLELQEQHDDAQEDRRAAAANRAKLLAGQEELATKYDALLLQQRALLRYLRRHGIDVPTRFLTTTVGAGRGTGSSSASSGAASSARPGKSGASRPRVDLPGKSERGQAHRPRHSRKP